MAADKIRVSGLLPTVGVLRRYFASPIDPLTSLFLILPLFLTYHLGVLTQVRYTPRGYAWQGNGVDFLTGTALQLSNGSPLIYGLGTVAVTLVLSAMILLARRKNHLHPRLFIPILAESTVYAVLITGTIGVVIDRLGLGILDTEGFLAQVIASCGAGLHEELVFRVGLFGGIVHLLERRANRPLVLLFAGLSTSLLFSAVHYIGPLGDHFSFASFGFRFLCGVAFAVIFRTRGFAIAAWSHALYDILYFILKRL